MNTLIVYCILPTLFSWSTLSGIWPLQIKVLLGKSVYMSASTHSGLTPDTVQARQALVTLDASVTAVALGRRVSLHPYMLHSLEGERETQHFVSSMIFNIQ